jgi:hypothetical protein
MPRWSEWVKLPDGTTAIVCYSGKKPSLCVRCRRRATIQCDFPIGGGRTCDTYLCRACAVPQGKNRDYCPDHVPRDAA